MAPFIISFRDTPNYMFSLNILTILETEYHYRNSVKMYTNKDISPSTRTNAFHSTLFSLEIRRSHILTLFISIFVSQHCFCCTVMNIKEVHDRLLPFRKKKEEEEIFTGLSTV